MALTTILSDAVRPDRLSTYEAAVHRLAERALAKKESFEWRTYAVTAGPLGTMHFVSEAASWAALAGNGDPVDMIRRVMGDTEGATLLEQLAGCVVSERTIVGQMRADISCPPDPGQPMRPVSLVTLFRARPGGQDAVEELIRKAAQAIPAVKDPRRFLAYQTVIGDLRTYWVVTTMDSLADLDGMLPPAELLLRAFGAEGALVHRTALDAIEQMERHVTQLRPELSNGAWVPGYLEQAAARTGAQPTAH